MTRIALTIAVCAAVIAGGLGAMKLLASMSEPPKQAEAREAALRVEAKEVRPEDIQATIKGYGQVRTLNTVAITAEVPGRVVHIHPDLEVGGVIPKGEVLFEIDPRDYEARLDQAQAAVAMNENTLERLRKQYAIDRERLKTLERSRELAEAEFGRMKELFEKDQVGTQSAVDQMERSYNAAADIAEQLGQAVTLYPVRTREAENMLASAKAALELAETSLGRTVVRAPFNARVKSVMLEAGQYVAPGAGVLSLADDSTLEISVSLDAREAASWLKFEAGGPGPGDAWFREVDPVACEIRWTEEKDNHRWNGTLNRIEKFDQQTRTVTAAVRIEGENARSADADKLPLVDGMFCEVRIPGRLLEDLYRLPSTAVNFEGVVYRSVEGRLKSTVVERAFIEGQEVFISQGLNPGDIVVTTRLVDPLENSLLEIVSSDAESEESPSERAKDAG